MQRVIILGVTIVLGIHAVFGCSCHSARRPVAKSKACCPNDDCGQDQSRPRQPARCGEQCGGVCTYLPPQRTLLDALVFDVSLPANVEASVPTVNAATSIDPADVGLPRYGPPLRLHLLHQLLLI